MKGERCSPKIVIENLYNGKNPGELLSIKTTYELKHLQAGKTIKYLSFSMPEILPPA